MHTGFPVWVMEEFDICTESIPCSGYFRTALRLQPLRSWFRVGPMEFGSSMLDSETVFLAGEMLPTRTLPALPSPQYVIRPALMVELDVFALYGGVVSVYPSLARRIRVAGGVVLLSESSQNSPHMADIDIQRSGVYWSLEASLGITHMHTPYSVHGYTQYLSPSAPLRPR